MVYTITPAFHDGETHQENGEGKRWKQWTLAISAYTAFFTISLQSEYLSKYRNEWTKDGIPYGETAELVASIISAVLACYLANVRGRKTVALLSCVLQIISWCPILFAINFTTLIISKVILGICLGSIYTVLPIYVREISEDRERGLIISLFVIIKNLGDVVMRSVIESDDLVLYGVIALLLVQMCVTLCLIESPDFYVKRRDFEKAAKAYASLKGIEEESISVKNKILVLTQESERSVANGNLTVLRILRTQIFRSGVKIGLMLYTMYGLCGSMVFLDHNAVLDMSGVEVNDMVWRIGMSGLMVAAGLFSAVLLEIWERKYLLTLSLSIMTIFLGVLGVFMQADMIATSLPWIPSVCLLFVVFGYGIGWGLTTVLLCEVFNLEIRAKMIGILFAYSKCIELAILYVFPYVKQYMGLYTLFYIFAGVTIYGCVYTLFGIPDTKNKSVKEIEKQLTRPPLLKFKTYVDSNQISNKSTSSKVLSEKS